MAVIELSQERRDQWLKTKYMEQVGKIINNPRLLSEMEAQLTPQTVSAYREDMEAIVRGEPETRLLRH